jgi:uncharacterized protein YoxC
MSTSALWAVFLVILLNTVFLAGIAVALWILNAKLNEMLGKAQPLLDKTSQALQRVEETTQKLSGRVDQMLDRAGSVVENVAEKVDTTTAIAEETISQPLIGAASLLAGLSRGLNSYKQAAEKGDEL